MFSFEQALAAKAIEQQQLKEESSFDFGNDSDRLPLLSIPADGAELSQRQGTATQWPPDSAPSTSGWGSAAPGPWSRTLSGSQQATNMNTTAGLRGAVAAESLLSSNSAPNASLRRQGSQNPTQYLAASATLLISRPSTDLAVAVAPHGSAGDLHMPRRTLDVVVPGMTSTSSRPDPSKPARGFGSSPGQPSTSAAAAGGPGTPRKDANEPLDDTFIDFDTDMATLRQQSAPWFRRSSFWWRVIPILTTLGFAIAAIVMRVTGASKRIFFLETWRWCFFFAGFVPIYYVSEGAVHLVEMAVESKLFTVQQALYFAVSIHKPVSRCLRACLALLLFLVAFADGREREEYVQLAWSLCIKLLICFILFCVANVVKTLLAKLLSSHFHKRAHFDKMQDALNKEYFLHALSQPRPHASLDLMQDPCRDLPDNGMRRSHSYHGLDPLGIPSAVYGAMHNIHASFIQAAHARHTDKQAAGSFVKRQSSLSSRQLQPRASAKDSFRSSDSHGNLCPGVGPSAGGGPAPAPAPAHVMSMLAEQEGQGKAGAVPAAPGRSGGPSFKTDPKIISRLHRLEKHMRENKLRHTFADQLGEAQESDELNSKKEARKLAFYLFWNVRPNFDRNFIVPMDLEFFMPPEKIPQALKVLDVDGDGKISLSDMRDAVIQIYKERKNLAYTLQDARGVVSKLELIMGAVMHILFVFFYLIIFDVDVNKVWLSFSSVFLAFVFVFGNSLRNMYESVIFLFVMHPYDVGDALFINGDWCSVEEIALQYTQVVRYDNVRIWYPNYVLCAGAVMNITRSAKRWESYKVAVDISTAPAVFEAVEAAAVAHFKANPTEFSGEKMIIANVVGDPLKFLLCVWWEYAYPGTELGRMGKARHGLYMCISKCLTEHNIRYTLPPYQPANSDAAKEQRPVGEGQKFMPPFMQKDRLKL